MDETNVVQRLLDAGSRVEAPAMRIAPARPVVAPASSTEELLVEIRAEQVRQGRCSSASSGSSSTDAGRATMPIAGWSWRFLRASATERSPAPR